MHRMAVGMRTPGAPRPSAMPGRGEGAVRARSAIAPGLRPTFATDRRYAAPASGREGVMAATRMPTAGRMTAAAAFAALAGAITLTAMPLLPEGLHVPNLPWWNALFGAVCGYRIVGLEAGDGMRGAVGRGLTAGAATALVALFLGSGARMIELSLRRRYDGVLDGAAGTFELMATYGLAVAAPQVIVPAVVGSALAGLLADAAQRRFT